MCLACEMDAWWFGEMEEAALKARAEAEGAAAIPEVAGASADAAPINPRPAAVSPFVCEETFSE